MKKTGDNQWTFPIALCSIQKSSAMIWAKASFVKQPKSHGYCPVFDHHSIFPELDHIHYISHMTKDKLMKKHLSNAQ